MIDAVQLRRAEPADAAFFHAVRAEPAAGRFQPLRLYTERELRKAIHKRSTAPLDPHLDGKVQWVILASDCSAGWISLDVTSREHGIGAVGYTVSEAFHGRGIASRALRLVIGIGFAPRLVNLERLEAIVAVENIASQRVLGSAGFTREGTARGLLRIHGIRIDHYRYALLWEDHPDADNTPGHSFSHRKGVATP